MIIFFFLCFILFLIQYFPYQKNTVKKKYQGPYKSCILIPARNESKVIEGLLKSIQNQTEKVSFKDVYIIIENKEDPTVEIASKYHANIVYRKDLTKRRKGYALDDAVKEILEAKKHYDFYFIFDADNVLDPNFFKEMKKSMEDGYDIGLGYRNCKNGNDSLVAAASSLTFSLMNTILNKQKQKRGEAMTISGTGFYIRGSILENLKGYPFYTLTEDYEFTLYSILENYTSTYQEKAIYYDEQPLTFKTSFKQRVRWIKGYFEARKKMLPKIFKSLKNGNRGSKIKELIGVTPIILLLLGLLFSAKHIIILLIVSYILLVFLTLILLLLEKQTLNLKPAMKIKVLFYHPIFLYSYILCALKALFQKDVAWSVIEHNKNL